MAVGALRPRRVADAVHDGRNRVHEHAPAFRAPRERRVLVAHLGVHAERVVVVGAHELPAPVEAPPFLAEPVHGRVVPELEADEPRVAEAGERRQSEAAHEVPVAGRRLHRAPRHRERERQRRVADLEHAVAGDEPRTAVERPRRAPRSGGRLAQQDAVVARRGPEPQTRADCPATTTRRSPASVGSAHAAVGFAIAGARHARPAGCAPSSAPRRRTRPCQASSSTGRFQRAAMARSAACGRRRRARSGARAPPP